ncbi:MAG TPA: DUF6544 family protein [Gemmatimonadaceae bacterium]
MLKLFVALVAIIVVTIAGVAVYGAFRWPDVTRDIRARLEAARLPVEPRVVDFAELEGLPEPVQRYFRRVLREGQPMITAVRVRHEGTFNMGGVDQRWMTFSSDQLVITRRPGFDWNARMRMMPGAGVRVHDAYVAGEGILYAALLGAIPVANLRGGGEIAEGELMRFFAESAWYPTPLLPSQGVEWEAVDDSSARATLRDGALAITLLFEFAADSTIAQVRAEARGRTVGKEIIPTPWQGRFSNYQEQSGMLVPMEGEVSWLLPEGPAPYWRGRIVEIEYEFAGER